MLWSGDSPCDVHGAISSSPAKSLNYIQVFHSTWQHRRYITFIITCEDMTVFGVPKCLLMMVMLVYAAAAAADHVNKAVLLKDILKVVLELKNQVRKLHIFLVC